MMNIEGELVWLALTTDKEHGSLHSQRLLCKDGFGRAVKGGRLLSLSSSSPGQAQRLDLAHLLGYIGWHEPAFAPGILESPLVGVWARCMAALYPTRSLPTCFP